MNIIDLHCDTLYKFCECDGYSFTQNDGHISEDGLMQGGYLAQCFAIYQPAKIKGEEGYKFFKNQYSLFQKLVKESESLEKASRREDIEKNLDNEKISAILTVENADFLQNDLTRVDEAERLGVKILGVIHNGENCLGYPQSTDKTLNNLPLKAFGKEVVEKLNYTSMTADVSHLNLGGFNDVAELSKKPFVATHSGCRELLDHPRNLYDSQIRKIAESGGIVGTVFYSDFLNGTNKTEPDDLLGHIEHLINVGGEDIAALGSDFDGMNCEMFISGASKMQSLAEILIKKFGFSVAEKICFKNAMRIFSI